MVTKKILAYWNRDIRVASLLRILHRSPSADNQYLTSSKHEHPMKQAIGGSKLWPPVLRQKAKNIETNIETRDNQVLRDIQGKLDPIIRYLNRRNSMPMIAQSS